MRLLLRTYVHSKRASFVSVAGAMISLVLFIVALVSAFNFAEFDNKMSFTAAVVCAVMAYVMFQVTRRLADHLALRDLEKKLGRPIVESNL